MRGDFLRKWLVAAVVCASGGFGMHASAQENWAADDATIEARRLERYQQLVDQSPEESYAFKQLMQSVGKGAAYTRLLRTYEEKVAKKPGDYTLRMVLGHMYRHGGRSEEALASYREAAKIRETALVYRSMGAAEMEARNYVMASASYERALAMTQDRTEKQEILRALAEIALARRDFAKAKSHLSALLAMTPNSLFLRRELSQIYAQNRLYEEARQVLSEAEKFSGTSSADRAQITLDVAELYEREGNDAEALRRYEALGETLSQGHWMQREILARKIALYRRMGGVEALLEMLTKSWRSPDYDQLLTLAALYEETNQPQEAIAHLLKAVTMRPGLPEARERLIDLYRAQGDNARVFEARRALIKAIPNHIAYRLDLADALWQQRQTDAAIEVLDVARKDFANDLDAQMTLADHYLMLGRGARAVEIYQAWLKKRPNEISVIEALGDYYATAGRRADAMEVWARIERIPMDRATKLETLARIYQDHNFMEAAEALYAKAIAASPKDCSLLSQYAEVLSRNDRFAEALQTWEQLAETCASRGVRKMAARQMADIYTKMSTSKVPAVFEEAKKRSQSWGQREASVQEVQWAMLMAELALALKRPDDALSLLSPLEAAHRHDTDLLRMLQAAHLARGDKEQAQAVLETLVARGGDDGREARMALVDLHDSMGELAKAQQRLAEVLDDNPNDALVNEMMADLYQRRRMYEQASHYYDIAFQIDPRNFGYAFKLATALSILGKDNEASALYVRIVAESPDAMLIEKSANRVIDDHAWRGELEALEGHFLPLIRAPRHQSLYTTILLRLALAQAQGHILALKSQSSQSVYTARHALRMLAEKYSRAILLAINSDDVFLQTQGLNLAQWLPHASVMPALGRFVAEIKDDPVLRDNQILAIRAMGYAQQPAAVPFLEALLEPHYPRAIREYAIWALGLIHSDSARAALLKVLEMSVDSFRALAIIGLTRQGYTGDVIARRLQDDPSPLVQDTAAWALAWMGVSSDAVRERFESQVMHNKRMGQPDDLIALGTELPVWGIAQSHDDEAAAALFRIAWESQVANERQMVARILRNYQRRNERQADTRPDISMPTAVEFQGAFVYATASYYAPHLSAQRLLSQFIALSTQENPGASANSWLVDHPNALREAMLRLARTTNSGAQRQMMRDLLYPEGLLGIDLSDEAVQQVVAQGVRAIEPYLKTWLDAKDEQWLGMCLELAAVGDLDAFLAQTIQYAKSAPSISLRIQAIQALARHQAPKAHDTLRELAGDDLAIIRATAVSHLSAQHDAGILEKAAKDAYAIVSKTASERLLLTK